MVTEHVVSMIAQFRQAATPANTDLIERAIVVGDFWYDTGAAVYKRCSSISPITFVSVEGGSAAHNVLSTTHGDSFATDTPVNNDVLTWVNANSRWEAVAAAGATHALGAPTTLTISGGKVTVTGRYHLIDTEAAGATDNLAGMAGGANGDIVVIRPANDARTVVITHEDTESATATDRFNLPGDASITLDDIDDMLAVVYDSTIARWIVQETFGKRHGDLSGVTSDQHHAQSHAHSAAGDGTTLTPAVLNIPNAASPAQTAEGSAVWDSDDDVLTVGDGTARKTLVNTDRSHDIDVWISAAAMKGTTTAGAGNADKLPESAETTTNKVNYDYIAFDTTTEENAFFQWRIPTGWNEGTITFTPYWTNAAGLTTETFVVGLKAVALSNDDALDTAFGTEVTVTDTWLAQNDVHIGPESAALTIGGTPAEGDLVFFNVARKTASDNLTGDARLLGIMLTYTRNNYTD